MGWTFMPKPNNVKQWIVDQLTWEDEATSQRVLASAVTLTEAHAAVERIDRATRERKVSAVSLSLKHIPGTSDPCNFGYKDFSEASGHGLVNCSATILDLLTPTDDRIANEWRQACRDRLATREAVKGIAVGDVVVFDRPLFFERYGLQRLFTYAGNGVVSRGDAFNVIGNGGLPIGYAKIRNWRNMILKRYPAPDLPRIAAQVAREDQREAGWTAALARLQDLPTAAFDAWIRAEARSRRLRDGGELALRRSLTDAGLDVETAAAVAEENVGLLMSDAPPEPLEALLRRHWTSTALATHLRGSSWERPVVARLFARTPGLAPAPGAHDLDEDLKRVMGQMVNLLREQDIDVDAPEFIGVWRYIGDNRAALLPVRTPEGHEVFLLVGVHQGSDRLSISGFTRRDTSETNCIGDLDLRPVVARPDNQRPDGDIAALRRAVSDLSVILASLDDAARSWDDDGAEKVAP